MQMLVENQLINYKISGAPLGPEQEPVVFLHGWGRTMADFDALVHHLALARPNLSFLQVDLPGFGGSLFRDEKGLSLYEYSRILAALLDRLNISRLILVGHSFGARIAIKFSAAFPGRAAKLVLISAAGASRKSLLLRLLAVGRLLFRFFFFGFGNTRLVRRLKYLLGRLVASRDYREASPPLRETLKKITAEDSQAEASRITAPTLLIWGSDDEVTPLGDGQKYRALIPGSRLEMIADCGHFPFLKQPETSSRLMASFLEHA